MKIGKGKVLNGNGSTVVVESKQSAFKTLGEETVISGLTILTNETSQKIFCGYIENVIVNNIDIKLQDNKGGLKSNWSANGIFSTIKNCSLNNITFDAKGCHEITESPAVVGYAYSSTINKINVNLYEYDETKITCENDSYIGLVVGYGKSSRITDITLNANVEITDNRKFCYVGTLAGYLSQCYVADINVIGSISTTFTKYDLHHYLGGVIGYATDLTANNITASNNVIGNEQTVSQLYVGGVFGYINNFDNVYNVTRENAKIEGKANVNEVERTLEDNYNMGEFEKGYIGSVFDESGLGWHAHNLGGWNYPYVGGIAAKVDEETDLNAVICLYEDYIGHNIKSDVEIFGYNTKFGYCLFRWDAYYYYDNEYKQQLKLTKENVTSQTEYTTGVRSYVDSPEGSCEGGVVISYDNKCYRSLYAHSYVPITWYNEDIGKPSV